MAVDLEAIQDPDFTAGLPAVVHLDFTREVGLDGPAYEWAVWAAAEIKRLGGEPTRWVHDRKGSR